MIDSKGYLMTPRSFIKPGLPQNVLNASGIIDIYCEEKLRRLLLDFRSKIMHPAKRVRASEDEIRTGLIQRRRPCFPQAMIVLMSNYKWRRWCMSVKQEACN